ncbi:hypothetical protein [Cohnella faecalis]|uniref:hypothetical protein n=1 Tax=Cohnella faecalis TaxID=2315694 RepID=UPI0011C2376A|nr:hypothetical protein [Cohnella faecalis]
MKRGAEVTIQIRDGIWTIGDRTTSVAAVAEQATKHAQDGNETVKQAVEQMERSQGRSRAPFGTLANCTRSPRALGAWRTRSQE